MPVSLLLPLALLLPTGDDLLRTAVPLDALEILEGELPSPTAPWSIRFGGGREALLAPHVVLDGPGEALVLDLRSDRQWAIRLAASVPVGRPVTGRLVAPPLGAESRVDVRFRLAELEADADGWRELVERHAARRWSDGVPGGALFRTRAAYRPPTDREFGALSAAFDPFRGTRRAADALLPRHFRDLAPLGPDEGEPLSPFAPILDAHAWVGAGTGWSAVDDPLLRVLPADRPAIVFPSIDAALAVLEEADRIGTPLLRLLEGESIETFVRALYEAQLALPTRRLAHEVGGEAIASVAVTSSDTSLREGADVAVLFEIRDPAPLLAWLERRHDDARFAHAEATTDSGVRDGVAWFAVRTPDRSVDSTVLAAEGVVAVTNSPAQVEALVDVLAGRAPALADRPEVRTLRARHPRDARESAFLVVSDPTFRRWTAAAWRVRTARRVRAAAALSDAAAREALRGEAPPPDVAPGLGRLGFLTPVAEVEVDRITNSEFLNARHAVRSTRSDRGWRRMPVIGAQVAIVDGGFDVDASIAALPLGAAVERARETANGRTFPRDTDDPRAATIVHAIVAIDFDALDRRGLVFEFSEATR
ncbi:MAG: hypothetical protein ACF8XB_13630, partial [Planctomycetota bacterium JB042]